MVRRASQTYLLLKLEPFDNLLEKSGTGIFLMKEKSKARKESIRKSNHRLSKRLSH